MPDPRDILRQLADAAIRAADPAIRVPAVLPAAPAKAIVLGAGKASAAMARAVETAWPETDLSGLVVTRYGYEVECERIEIVPAAHPVPDEAGREAARRILELAEAAGPDDLVLALISGGGSALLTAPADGITFEEKQEVNRQLLRCGADIGEMNTLRKHISAIKGGRLAAAAHPARVLSILISDVPGDDPAVIGSGPTVPDPTTFADALGVVEKYGLALPASVARHLEAGAAETPKPGDPVFDGNELIFAAKPDKSIEAAAEVARAAGFAVVDLGDRVEGEAREVGREHAEIAVKCKAGNGPASAPCVILSGGETTVTMTGDGRGGRNTEYLLGVAEALKGAEGIYAVACDTDGVDGSEDNAGAFVDPTTLERAAAAGLSVADALGNNDAYTLFDNIGDLLVTGPTYTNVNDFRAVVVT
ncbi:MAG: glycerate kinase [Rhodospirillales bacterium]|nr:glycerate kinase [Rhodospirillales bacterium]MBO6787104.1 glycerate kinase [Rhodospirillales bacterium]